jgi:hypothetical protein
MSRIKTASGMKGTEHEPLVVCFRAFSFITSNEVPKRRLRRVPKDHTKVSISSHPDLHAQREEEAYSFRSTANQTQRRRRSRNPCRGGPSVQWQVRAPCYVVIIRVAAGQVSINGTKAARHLSCIKSIAFLPPSQFKFKVAAQLSFTRPSTPSDPLRCPLRTQQDTLSP